MSKAAKPALQKLGTEQANLATAALDTRSAREIAETISAEDARVAPAVARALPEIARTIDAIAQALSSGGRLIYVGAGTSGRLAALDAAECPPTFNTDPEMVQFVMSGGERALGRAAEASEDWPALGRRDIAKRKPGKRDVVVGISASGRTPYTVAALRYARSHGATTVAVTNNRGSWLERVADIAIVADVGAEVVAGSTRMKAGSAQKMILNMLSTGAMARLGYVYGNLMVNVHVKNKKLLERGVTVLERAAGVSREVARRALKAGGNSVPVALVMLKARVSKAEARRRLKAARGGVRRAIVP
ncbi:MAG TPA: N-acetylmuramic acid 6-phosphate etherase [Terriglobales bacterium]|nr:N-acetylmuramic acid 6-phosphate etherase [Terriglobales bacterium]